METISGSANWDLTARRDRDGVTILRAVTCDREAALPETLWGLSVTVIGARALSPGAAAVDGERVRIQCGRGGEWDNGRLRALTLPPTLRRVEDYALYNCRALERLRLHDTVAHWGSGVLLNCGALGRIDLTRGTEDGGGLAYFAGELNGELDITVRGTVPAASPDGPASADGTAFPADGAADPESGIRFRLIFPAYRELYEENSPAHHFDYTIEGAGYPYHHCFQGRRLHFPEYDRLFPALVRLVSAGDGDAPFRDFRDRTVPGGWAFEPEGGVLADTRPAAGGTSADLLASVRLAWWRLRYPAGMGAEAAARYRAWVERHAETAMTWLIRERDFRGLSRFLQTTTPDRTALQSAAAYARERREPEASALLMETLHRRFPVRTADRFAL